MPDIWRNPRCGPPRQLIGATEIQGFEHPHDRSNGLTIAVLCLWWSVITSIIIDVTRCSDILWIYYVFFWYVPSFMFLWNKWWVLQLQYVFLFPTTELLCFPDSQVDPSIGGVMISGERGTGAPQREWCSWPWEWTQRYDEDVGLPTPLRWKTLNPIYHWENSHVNSPITFGISHASELPCWNHLESESCKFNLNHPKTFGEIESSKVNEHIQINSLVTSLLKRQDLFPRILQFTNFPWAQDKWPAAELLKHIRTQAGKGSTIIRSGRWP